VLDRENPENNELPQIVRDLCGHSFRWVVDCTVQVSGTGTVRMLRLATGAYHAYSIHSFPTVDCRQTWPL
jgi:hypothetical protein